MEHGSIIMPKQCSSDDIQQQPSPLRKVIAVASIAAGIQFGWALQLSLLTPYVQTLGVPHMWASFIWLCGPLSGLLVQPLVGYYSDRCGRKCGRRTPFIISGAVFVCIAVIFIGFAAEIGVQTGDSATALSKPRAVSIFVVGFWVLDVANNMLQGPCRALLADMSAGNHSKMRTANSFFSFFMAIGNVLGYAAGSYDKLYKILHFSLKPECDAACANLKTCFIFSVCLLIIVTVMALTTAREKPHIIVKDEGDKHTIPFFGELFASLKTLERPMWLLLLVTALNWIAWFPWLLYDTDWMGREIFGGDAKGTPQQKDLFERGVHAGSLGLLINSVVLALMSLALEPLIHLLRGAKNLWGLVNILLAVCLALTAVVSHMAKEHRNGALIPPSPSVEAFALIVFALLGIPLSVTFSIPFALASIYCSSSGGGQGLSLGVLNLSIVIPQMIVSVSSGHLDKAFGGGNLAAFIMGAIVAAISAFCAIFLLPNPPKQQSAEENPV